MMEEAGYFETNESLLNRVAKYLADNESNIIDTYMFHNACIACNVDPDSFTEKDLEILQLKLNKHT